MGRTHYGQSAPYCTKCEKHALPLRAKFGTPCPMCATPTVNYSDWQWQLLNLAAAYARSLRPTGRTEEKDAI